MTGKKLFSKTFQINHALVVVLPKDFCQKHGIRKVDYIERQVDGQGIRFVPQEVDR